MRDYSNKLIELVEEGTLNPVEVVRMCVKYMSEDEVEEMCNMNELTDLMFEPEEKEEDELEDEKPTEEDKAILQFFLDIFKSAEDHKPANNLK